LTDSIESNTALKEGQAMTGNNSKTATVLFVDDSRLMRRAAESALSQNYQVILAGDGTEALKAIVEHQEIQVVLTDLSMPKMDGHALIEKIKTSSDAKLRQLPVLVVTGSASDQVVKQVRQAGAAGVMTKPFTPEALIQRVRQLLDADQNETPESRPSIESVDAQGAPICIESSVNDLDRRLRQTLALHIRHDLPLSVMQLRIANINEIEARHGERIAHAVMKFAQKVLGQTLRDEDSVGQTRRDTFTLVLPMTTDSGSKAVADRLQQAFRKKKVAVRGQVIELELALAICDSGLSDRDVECITAGRDQPTLMTNIIKFELPASEQHPAAARAMQGEVGTAL